MDRLVRADWHLIRTVPIRVNCRVPNENSGVPGREDASCQSAKKLPGGRSFDLNCDSWGRRFWNRVCAAIRGLPHAICRIVWSYISTINPLHCWRVRRWIRHRWIRRYFGCGAGFRGRNGESQWRDLASRGA